MSKRSLVLLLFALPVLVAGGFYLHSMVRRAFFQNATKPEAQLQAQLRQQAFQSEAGTKEAVTLYFPDFDTGELAPEARLMALAPNADDRVRQIILALIAGSTEGHGSALPASAAVRAVFITAGGDAYLDFSRDVTQDFPAGIASENLVIHSIVDSVIANVPGIKRVAFLIQGQEADTLDGHDDLTSFYTADLPPSAASLSAP